MYTGRTIEELLELVFELVARAEEGAFDARTGNISAKQDSEYPMKPESKSADDQLH
jgi:hypothetical protein